MTEPNEPPPLHWHAYRSERNYTRYGECHTTLTTRATLEEAQDDVEADQTAYVPVEGTSVSWETLGPCDCSAQLGDPPYVIGGPVS
ncbi:hypothetical protein [Kribbella sp. DT2]|uniref:hypothetical protein n=1 Tax=Kribbella sp. DT2 TaxID=3393427 RepID=UPI003CF56C94